jgi:hypothetical protein
MGEVVRYNWPYCGHHRLPTPLTTLAIELDLTCLSQLTIVSHVSGFKIKVEVQKLGEVKVNIIFLMK